MDKKLKDELLATIRAAEREAHEIYDEHWLTGDQLVEQFGMFTKDWLKRYGHSLPRTRAVVRDEQGELHQTGWAYPRNKIQRMIQENEIKHLRCLSVCVANVRAI